MAKRNDLHRKLKAADRRRGRRPSAPQPTTQQPAQGIDIAGLLVAAILEHRQQHKGANDAVVISALRGLIHHTEPSSEPSSSLYRRCLEISEREEVEMRCFRTSVEALLEQARHHSSDSGGSDTFITYLAVLAD